VQKPRYSAHIDNKSRKKGRNMFLGIFIFLTIVFGAIYHEEISTLAFVVVLLVLLFSLITNKNTSPVLGTQAVSVSVRNSLKVVAFGLFLFAVVYFLLGWFYGF
jgi:hypothetical protein